MKHEDFIKEYMDIKKKEVKAINEALKNLPAGTFTFKRGDGPYVNCYTHGADEPSQSEVVKVTFPVSDDCGILVRPTYDNEVYEVGALNVAFGDINTILDNMPEV